MRTFPINEEVYTTIKESNNELEKSRQLEQSQGPEAEEQELTHETMVHKCTEALSDILISDPILFDKCRELGLHFEWVLVTLQLLCPPVEEKGMMPKLGFKCLHAELCMDDDSGGRVYPYYAIDLEHFLSIVSHVDSKLTRDEFVIIAGRIGCLEIHSKYGQLVLYDKLILAIRNATFSKEEIKELVKSDDDQQQNELVQPQKGNVSYNPLGGREDSEVNFYSPNEDSHKITATMSPKLVEVHLNETTRKIEGIFVEHLDSSTKAVIADEFGIQNKAQEHTKITLSCELDENIDRVTVQSNSIGGEVISLAIYTDKDHKIEVVTYEEEPEGAYVHEYKMTDNAHLKGFYGTFGEHTLEMFGVITWEAIEVVVINYLLSLSFSI